MLAPPRETRCLCSWIHLPKRPQKEIPRRREMRPRPIPADRKRQRRQLARREPLQRIFREREAAPRAPARMLHDEPLRHELSHIARERRRIRRLLAAPSRTRPHIIEKLCRRQRTLRFPEHREHRHETSHAPRRERLHPVHPRKRIFRAAIHIPRERRILPPRVRRLPHPILRQEEPRPAQIVLITPRTHAIPPRKLLLVVAAIRKRPQKRPQRIKFPDRHP